MLKPYDIAELFGRAYLKCTTGEIAGNGFRATGIDTFDPQVLTDVDFIVEASNNNQACQASDNQGTSVVADQNAPGTSTAVQKTPTDLILPQDILPFPG